MDLISSVVPDIPGDPLAYTILRRMESFAGSINSQTGTLYNVQKALERGGVEFLNDDRPGVDQERRRTP
jgi:hypothetical protein